MNLAIKGHYTRGEEVIKILEMLGGRNVSNLDGNATYYYYTIANDKEIIEAAFYLKAINDKFYILSLEEFEKKFPYKIGDKVQHKEATSCGTVYEIEQMGWEDNQVKYIICDLYWKNVKCTATTENLQPYKEDIMEIKPNIIKDKLAFIDIANSEYNEVDTIELLCDDKFEIEIIHENQIVLNRKQPQYPKTYEECCKVLGADPSRIIVLSNRKDIIHEENKHCFEMYNLYQLLICRDAYWKMAGKQMGCGNPWEPDSKNKVYYIFYCVSNNTIKRSEGNLYSNAILSFPTKEMRDDFLENFKELIELCKELL